MADTYQTVLDRINGVTQLLSGIPAGNKKANLQSIQKELAGIGSRVQAAQKQEMNKQNADETRDMLAGCRAVLYGALKEIEELLTGFADAYRQSIGDKKNEFEKWSAVMQQNFDQEAYQNKLAFGQLSACRDQIRLLTSSIMDLEGQLEHSQLVQEGLLADVQTNTGDLGEASDRASLSP